MSKYKQPEKFGTNWKEYARELEAERDRYRETLQRLELLTKDLPYLWIIIVRALGQSKFTDAEINGDKRRK
jgi:hypothetical protein